MRWQDIPACKGFVETDLSNFTVPKIKDILKDALKEHMLGEENGHPRWYTGDHLNPSEDDFCFYFFTKNGIENRMFIYPESSKLNFYLPWQYEGNFKYNSELSELMMIEILLAFKSFGEVTLIKRLEIPITEEYIKL